MNSRYLIVLLLLGGIVYGLTTAVGGMLAEDEPMSVCSAQVEWSSVPNVGVSAPAERSFSVPASSRRGSSLFHHPAVYSGVSVPQGYSGSGLTTGVLSSGTYAVSSAYSPSQGLYLTSSAVYQSYGGGGEMANSSVGGNITAQTAIASAPASSASDMPVHIYYSLSVGQQQHSLSDLSWYAQRSSAYASSVGAFASADRTLAASQSAPRRGGGAPTIDDAWTHWLENEWAGGRNDLTLDELRALYDKMRAEDKNFADTYTWDDFLEWFGYRQNDETFKWRLPVGDGMPFLLLLCACTYVYIYIRNRKYKKEISK